MKDAISWRRFCACFAGVWAFFGGAAIASSIVGLEVRPDHLAFDVKLNEPIVLQVEVTAQDDLGEVDLMAEGLRIQREIGKPARNRRVFLIEPDTSNVGRVSGSIAVVKKSGEAFFTIPVSGEVKPYVRVAPIRLFLGSLEYGTVSDRMIEKSFRLSSAVGWKITNVDVSDIAGAAYELRDLDDGAKELRLRFSEEAMKMKLPFGAFINRTIRIKTNVLEQTEISIPVTAMLSRNGSARNFNTFIFKGNERWRGLWATPNLAGAVVAPLVLLAIGYGMWLWRVQSRWPIVTRSIAAILAVAGLVGMVLLVMTYSRGGWVAFGIGLAAMILLMKGYRRGLAAAILALILIVGALPSGVQRATSTGEVVGDLSIRNRLLVWRGALEMIADHPLDGVGVGRFGDTYSEYYQEPWHKASYSTAINDYLTFAAERGLPLVLTFLGGFVLLAALATQVMRENQDAWVVPVICALLTICVSALFSSIEFVREVRILLCATAAILLAYCLYRTGMPEPGRRTELSVVRWRLWMRSVGVSFAIVCLAGGIVVWADATRSVRHLVGQSEIDGRSEVSSVTYFPGKGVSRGTVLFLPQEPQPMEFIGKQILRPLAQNGWRAMAVTLPPYDQEASEAVKRLIQQIGGPVIILAEKSKARVAMGAALSAPQGLQPRLAFVEPILFSALSECDKSHAPGISAGLFAIIDVKQWEAFKQDNRTEGRAVSETLGSRQEL